MKIVELYFNFKVLRPSYRVDWFWSNRFRGFLGMKLKQIFCIQRNVQCVKCIVQETCSYFQTYEINDRTWRISPPDKGELFQGNYLKCKIVLWSNSVDWAIHMIKSAECFESNNLKLDSVKCFDLVVYKDRNIISRIEPRKIQKYIPSGQKFKLCLRTPLRVKIGKSLITGINQKNVVDIFGLQSSEGIKIDTIFEDWIDFKRFSYRQKQYMRIGGIVGKYNIIDTKGELAEFLSKGNIVGLGKAKTFGFGDITFESC